MLDHDRHRAVVLQEIVIDVEEEPQAWEQRDGVGEEDASTTPLLAGYSSQEHPSWQLSEKDEDSDVETLTSTTSAHGQSCLGVSTNKRSSSYENHFGRAAVDDDKDGEQESESPTFFSRCPGLFVFSPSPANLPVSASRSQKRNKVRRRGFCAGRSDVGGPTKQRCGPLTSPHYSSLSFFMLSLLLAGIFLLVMYVGRLVNHAGPGSSVLSSIFGSFRAEDFWFGTPDVVSAPPVGPVVVVNMPSTTSVSAKNSTSSPGTTANEYEMKPEKTLDARSSTTCGEGQGTPACARPPGGAKNVVARHTQQLPTAARTEAPPQLAAAPYYRETLMEHQKSDSETRETSKKQEGFYRPQNKNRDNYRVEDWHTKDDRDLPPVLRQPDTVTTADEDRHAEDVAMVASGESNNALVEMPDPDNEALHQHQDFQELAQRRKFNTTQSGSSLLHVATKTKIVQTKTTGIEVATVVTSCCIAAMFVGLSVQIRDMWKKGFPHCLNPRDNEVAHDEPVLQERGGGDDGPLPVSPSHSSTSKRKDETQTETSSPAQLEAAGDAASATPQDLRVQIPAFMGEAAANLEKGMDNPRLAAQTNIRDVIEILAELSLADMLPGDVTSLSPALGRKRSDEVFPNYFAFLREEGTERIFLWAAAIQASADEKQAAEIEAFTNPEEAFTPKDKRDLFSAVADGIAAEVVRTGATSASDVRQAEGPRSSIASFLAVDPVGRKFVAEVLGDWLGPGANCRDKDSGACPVQHLPPPRPQAVALFRLTQEVLKKLQEEDRDAVFQNLVDARMPDGAIGAVYGRAMIYQKSHCVKGNDGREPDGGRERSPLMRAAFAQFKREAQEEAADAGGRAPELETLLNAQVQEFLRQVGVGGGVVLQEQDKKEQAGAMASASGSRDPQGALEAGADAAQHGSGPALAAEEQKPNSSQPSHRATAAAGGSGQPSVVTTGAAANSSTAVRAAANPLGPGPEPAALRPGPGAVASGVRSAAATSGAAGGGPAGRVGPDAPQHLQSRPVIAAQHATQPTASTGKQPPEQAKNSKCC